MYYNGANQLWINWRVMDSLKLSQETHRQFIIRVGDLVLQHSYEES